MVSYDLKEAGDYVFEADIKGTGTLKINTEVFDFQNATGKIRLMLFADNELDITLGSAINSYIMMRNISLFGAEKRYDLDRYILIPGSFRKSRDSSFLKSGLLKPFWPEYIIEDNHLENIELISTRVIRYSNFSNRIIVELKCNKETEKNYQLDLRYLIDSITELTAGEDQRNSLFHRLNPRPPTGEWEKGEVYTASGTRLFSPEEFKVIARFFDPEKKVFTQGSFFDAKADIVFEDQTVGDTGKAEWININFGRDKEGNIRLSGNSWIETRRYDLDAGSYLLSFEAHGTEAGGEKPQLLIKDHELKDIMIMEIDSNTKKYIVEIKADTRLEDASFVIMHTNHGGKRDVIISPEYEIIENSQGS
jgi:hypothetical protein